MSEVTKRLIEHYERSLSEHGATARGMDWENEERLKIRFEAMIRSLGARPKQFSVLDVGCGSGLLADYLLGEGYSIGKGRGERADKSSTVRYTGVDASAKMIEAAGRRHPEIRFSVCDATRLREEFEEGEFDFVVSNGLFTLKNETTTEEMDQFFNTVLRQMYDCCRIGIAFNVMTKHVDFEVPHLYYRDPGEVLEHCVRHLSRRISLHHDYPLYEFFTVVRRP